MSGEMPYLGDASRIVLAAILFITGLAILAISFRTFGRAGTTINPIDIGAASALVTGGIYRFTRNPMYLGLALVLVAWAAFLAAPWVLLGPVLFVLFIQRFQIDPEERVMADKFGTEYAAYCRAVRRWL